MNNPYEDNMYKGTSEFVKSELKTGIFWYVIISIISKVFAYTVGILVAIVVFLSGKVYRLFMTEEERKEHDEEYRQVLMREQEEEYERRKVREIAELEEITRIYNEGR
ncbi:hypothetical protein ACFL20_10465 [Spirochaetota bacterium]